MHIAKCNDILKLNVKNQIYNLKDLMKQNKMKATLAFRIPFCFETVEEKTYLILVDFRTDPHAPHHHR